MGITLAQAAIGHWAIWLIIVAAIVACVVAGFQYFKVEIPALIVTLFWICVGACILVVAVKFLVGLA